MPDPQPVERPPTEAEAQASLGVTARYLNLTGAQHFVAHLRKVAVYVDGLHRELREVQAVMVALRAYLDEQTADTQTNLQAALHRVERGRSDPAGTAAP